MNRPRCPYSKSTGGYNATIDEHIEGADWCSLGDDWCLLTSGEECEEYNTFLTEEENEEGG